eukprot:TRINITY_DN18591_c0_g1_i2.p1 TRINITY_DN18591_c0_g1~~TRINITY_DN18591_c0_g1_i2.p1  ORF type:complete len:647 (+),score=146.63 TRINITY_DN18591_c0_g1_i2:63-1943(+)
MSLRRTCRELVLEVVIKKALATEGADGLGRLQMVVDETGLRALSSFLKMGDLHAEGITSMELIAVPREPLPLLDALYFLRPDQNNLDLVLADYKTAAGQHRQVHFCFTGALASETMKQLAEAQHLAPRVRSFVEVPLSFVLVQDRGFHFDMPEALPGLFPMPDPVLLSSVVSRLVDVCRCLQTTAPVVRHGGTEICQSVAQRLLETLALHRTSAKQEGPPCQVLIIDRSIDMAATLVHEYTYEACVYDLLDGDILDATRNVVTLPASGGIGKREVLLSDNDPLWQELKQLHLLDVKNIVDQKVEEIKSQQKSKDHASMSTTAMLEMLRKSPEQRDAIDRVFLHLSMVDRLFSRIEEEKLTSDPGYLEQDVACGVDKNGKEAKISNLQERLASAFKDIPGDPKPLSSESKLRLLMLYFACVAGITDGARRPLMEMAKLSSEDQQVLQSMMRTRLMEVPEHQRHKVTRFKKNAKESNRFELSRFEPRLQAILEQLAEHRLSQEDFPVTQETDGGLRQAGAALLEQHGAPAIQAKDDWSFAGWTGAAAAKEAEEMEVSQRIIVFVIGGFTYSELRAAAEVEHKMPRGTEVLIGGTSLFTPRRLISVLRPQRSSETAAQQAEGGDPMDLT